VREREDADDDDPTDDITTGHPSAHLRAAPAPGDEPAPIPTAAFPSDASLPSDPSLPAHAVSYGPDIADEGALRLIGHVAGKRVLELGAGAGHNAIVIARQGAHTIVVDPSHRRLERLRARCDDADVRVEAHQSDLAELAFIRADTIDIALSVFALESVVDLDRVFRQVHRVLRTEAPFVFSLPHPAFVLTQGGSYFDDLPRSWQAGESTVEEIPRTIGAIFASLMRANFRVDTLLEPEPRAAPRSQFWVDAMSRAPATLIVRARKLGL
jgi:SAM-dependent methyltransferase